MSTLYTIGYGGRTPPQLAAVLKEHGIGVLVDVRASPQSRIPGFSKKALRQYLPMEGIVYHHITALGNINRNAGPDAPVALLDEAAGLKQLAWIVLTRALTESNPGVAIMCAERDHRGCHRTYIADRLSDPVAGQAKYVPDLQIAHLP